MSMIKTNIHQFVSTQQYGSLIELQEAVKRWEIVMELQSRELRQGPMQSQPAAKRFKPADLRYGGQMECTCGKYGKVHEGSSRSSVGCHKYGKEGNF